MAKKKPCRECGEPVSTRAPACPHCRTPNPVSSASGAVAGKLLSTIGWIVGGLLIFLGVVGAFRDPISGLLMVGTGAVLFPPARRLFEEKTGIKLSGFITAIVAAVLFFAVGLTAG